MTRKQYTQLEAHVYINEKSAKVSLSNKQKPRINNPTT